MLKNIVKNLKPSSTLKINEVSKMDNLEYFKVFYDFETTIEGKTHKPYLMCCITQTGQKRVFYGADCGKDFTNYLKKLKQDKILLIANFKL